MIWSVLVYLALGSLSLGGVWWMLRNPSGSNPPVADAVRVHVGTRYEPDTIRATVGRPIRLIFRREDSLACSEQVTFPAFGRSVLLPPHQDVAVQLVPERAGSYEFTCRMGVLRGRLLVAADERVPAGSGRA